MQFEIFSDESKLEPSVETLTYRATTKVPHPIPYQGSKRKLASAILRYTDNRNIRTFYEPFAGSAATTIAAASRNIADIFRINDSLCPLAGIWKLIVNDPVDLAVRYEEIWNDHKGREPDYYYDIRKLYNSDHDPAKLLYLLARCVKSAVRFNAQGEFNQSVDKRRLGTRPGTMRRNILESHAVLRDRTFVTCDDYRSVLDDATSKDVVYMDPPWQGTSTGKDNRYHQSLDRSTLFTQLNSLNERDIPFILSFDGRCGNKTYGDPLPSTLDLHLVELNAGRSSQSTLSGRKESTIESLYLSYSLVKHIDNGDLRDGMIKI